MTTEEVVATAAPAPAIAREAAHHSHAHLVFPNLLDTFRSLLSIIVIALFVLTFVVQPFRIPSESMERTLLVGDFLLVNKSVYGKQGAWHWLLPYEQVQSRRRDRIPLSSRSVGSRCQAGGGCSWRSHSSAEWSGLRQRPEAERAFRDL